MRAAPTASQSERIVELLSNSATHADRPASIRTLETHISWVFLTTRFAYKLKKPVRFEFLDFSTPELRHRACLEEVRLNRRLAPDVYLDVLPITSGSGDALALAGAGEPVDWVVKMRRLPASQALDKLLRRDALTADQVQALAQHLVDFYARLPPERLSRVDYCQSLERHIRANGDSLLPALPRQVIPLRRALGAQLRYLRLHADLFGQRIAQGRIVEGHGDLRPEHIYLEDPPAIIDCIEFSAELRTVDVADELSFLALECERLGHSELGDEVLSTYQRVCDDQVFPALLAFYKSYRASVRAKVALLRARQVAPTAARPLARDIRQYINLADDYAAQLGPPSLVVVGGLMGTGKSTLAQTLADSLACDLLATDRVRRSMVGASAAPLAYGQGIYRPQIRHRVYNELFRQARRLLDRGQSVTLDGAFLSRRLRREAFQLAQRRGAVPLCVWCECPRDVALSRITKRVQTVRSDSEGRADLYDSQANELEPLERGDPAVTVDTTNEAPRKLQTVFTELRRRLFDAGRPPP